MSPYLSAPLLLVLSNCFMTFAWYAHLKDGRTQPWLIMALMSWGIALFEYLIMVPANRIGFQVYTLPQLKIMQEVITLTVFIPFAVFYMKQPFSWNYVGAALCMVGAVWFMFRG
ncbi:DMT family protein [Chitinibacteraceae bacterium HSL-7]